MRGTIFETISVTGRHRPVRINFTPLFLEIIGRLCSGGLRVAWGVQTAGLRQKEGGAISDISVGGDRLFVLHNEEDVFDVWETPRPSNIVETS